MLEWSFCAQNSGVLFECLMYSQYNKIIPLSKQAMTQDLFSFVQSLGQNGLYRKILSLGCHNYSIRPMRLETITPEQLFQHLKKFQEMNNQQASQRQSQPHSFNSQSWSNNQFKIFAWISVCYSYLKQKSFHLFDSEDYMFLREAFPHKSREFLHYNLRILSKESTISRRAKWTEEEIKLFQSIMREQTGQYKWTQISFQLFYRSDGEAFQTPQKCRQQWINHLNPEVNKDKWTIEEDILLLRSVLREGKKWSHISKIYNGSRTEHMVKNRYKSILHKNQFKAKKVAEKKFCQNILIALEKKQVKAEHCYQKRYQLESKAQNSSQNLVVMNEKMQEMPQFSQSQLIKIQSQTEHFTSQIPEDVQGLDEKKQNAAEQEQSQPFYEPQSSMVELQEIELFQQVQYKTEEEIYIESLLS